MTEGRGVVWASQGLQKAPRRMAIPEGCRSERLLSPSGCSWFNHAKPDTPRDTAFVLACLQQGVLEPWRELDGPTRLYLPKDEGGDLVFGAPDDPVPEEDRYEEVLARFVELCRRRGVLLAENGDLWRLSLAPQFGGHAIAFEPGEVEPFDYYETDPRRHDPDALERLPCAEWLTLLPNIHASRSRVYHSETGVSANDPHPQ